MSQWILADETATERLAKLVAQRAPRPLRLGLSGPVGAGKTTFTRHLLKALGRNEGSFQSPTFTLVNEYELPDGRVLAHLDVYRLPSAGDVWDLGFEDDLASDKHLVVEWADRFPEIERSLGLRIAFEIREDGMRLVTIAGDGEERILPSES